MVPRLPLLTFAPNRVWRTYLGGRTLDEMAAHRGGAPTAGSDNHFPEDWVASTTEAVNPADATRFPIADRTIPEGISQAWTGLENNLRTRFDHLLREQAQYFLGDAHLTAFGSTMQLLVKLLDPGIRLHFQVHPTAAFARDRLNAPSGKTEAYHILSIRQDLPHPPYIYLGFQRPPTRDALRAMIAEQDIAALEKCFDRIPVNVGDTIFVPGGVPHALGPGILLVEIMEPSDLVVRCEFSRGGYTIPEAARFLGRDLEFCLDVFDYSEWPLRRILGEAFCPPRRRRALGPDSSQDNLIGPERTSCFRVRRSTINAPVVRRDGEPWIGILTAGEATFRCGDQSRRLHPFEPCFVAAGADAMTIEPHPSAHLLECLPPTP